MKSKEGGVRRVDSEIKLFLKGGKIGALIQRLTGNHEST